MLRSAVTKICNLSRDVCSISAIVRINLNNGINFSMIFWAHTLRKVVPLAVFLCPIFFPAAVLAQSCGSMRGYYSGENAAFDAINDLSRIMYCLHNSNRNFSNRINSTAFDANVRSQRNHQDLDSVEERLQKLVRDTEVSDARFQGIEASSLKAMPNRIDEFESEIDVLRETIVLIERRLTELEATN